MKNIIRNNRTNTTELFIDESIFSLANGIMGVRGNFVEGYGLDHYKQTYLNGFYNLYDYKYEENSVNFPQQGERVINILDGQSITFYVKEKPINLSTCTLISLKRTFDLTSGFTIRKCQYQTEDGFIFEIQEEKMVSFYQKELLLLRIQFSSINYTGDVLITSSLQLPDNRIEKSMDPRINSSSHKELDISKKTLKAPFASIYASTTKSHLNLVASIAHNQEFQYSSTDIGIDGSILVTIHPNTKFAFTKYVVFTTDLNHQDLEKENLTVLTNALNKGFDFYLTKQKEYLNSFWEKSEVKIIGNDYLDFMMHYSLYQLNASHANQKEFNIASKGLSGEGYEGHYFWDTEIYMFPFFLYTDAPKAKSLLMNRYIHLSQAKEAALKLGAKTGAKIPWRTISGNELSPYFPAGSAQYHINSDVAYTIIKYIEVTNDLDFLFQYGFEMLVETARFLLDVGNFSKDGFHLNSVTGPDEYTTLVNDNYYTNAMAKFHFESIVSYFQLYNEDLTNVISKINLTINEIRNFEKAAKQMTFFFDTEKNIYAQDESFLQKQILDLTLIPKGNFPLLLHYHPLFIYRQQVLKQADTLLAMFLLNFHDEDILQDTFNYYLPLTTHDSSLSKCIHSIVAAKLGATDIAYDYLLDVVKIDFENTYNNTDHGLHIANLGGSYLAILHGLLGLRTEYNNLLIHPVLPKQITGFELKIFYKGVNLHFLVNRQLSIYVDKPIQIGVYNELVFIENEYHCELYIQKTKSKKIGGNK